MSATGRYHATDLVGSIGAGVGTEPGDEGIDGEGLRKGGVRTGGDRRRGSILGGSSGRDGVDSRSRCSAGDRGGGGLGCGRAGWCGRDCRGHRRGRGSRCYRGSRGSRSSRSRRRRGGAGTTSHAEVDAGLISLVDASSIPVPLNDTVTSGGALRADIGHSDVERSPVRVLGQGGRSQSILVPADQGRANNGVRAGLDDGDVGDTIVRSADLDSHGNDLTSGVGKDLAGVRERHTLALPHAAVRVRALKVLESALNIAIVIRRLLVVDLLTASGLETIARSTGSGRGDEAVSGNGGNEASEGNGSGVGLHSDC